MATKYIVKKDAEDMADHELLKLQALRNKLQKMVDRAPHNATGISIHSIRGLLFDPESFDA